MRPPLLRLLQRCLCLCPGLLSGLPCGRLPCHLCLREPLGLHQPPRDLSLAGRKLRSRCFGILAQPRDGGGVPRQRTGHGHIRHLPVLVALHPHDAHVVDQYVL